MAFNGSTVGWETSDYQKRLSANGANLKCKAENKFGEKILTTTLDVQREY